MTDPHSLIVKEKEVLIAHTLKKLDNYKMEMEDRIRCELNEKENILLEKFSSEWNKQRVEMETEIVNDIEHCKNMINQLNSIANEVKTRAYATAERENKLRLTKEQLNALYQSKYYELKEASKRAEHHYQHRMQVQDLHTQELKLRIEHLEKANASLKERIVSLENSKKSSISLEEAASLNEQMECLNNKLTAALQQKFKDKLVSPANKSVPRIKNLNIQTNKQPVCSGSSNVKCALITEKSLLLEDQKELQKLRTKLMNAVNASS